MTTTPPPADAAATLERLRGLTDALPVLVQASDAELSQVLPTIRPDYARDLLATLLQVANDPGSIVLLGRVPTGCPGIMTTMMGPNAPAVAEVAAQLHFHLNCVAASAGDLPPDDPGDVDLLNLLRTVSSLPDIALQQHLGVPASYARPLLLALLQLTDDPTGTVVLAFAETGADLYSGVAPGTPSSMRAGAVMVHEWVEKTIQAHTARPTPEA